MTAKERFANGSAPNLTREWKRVRAEIFAGVFGVSGLAGVYSPFDGLDELAQIAVRASEISADLERVIREDLEQLRELVQRWFDLWWPPDVDGRVQ